MRVAAQVPAAGAAVAAVAAGDVALAGDAVADREAAHFAAERDDLAAVLVADLHRHRDRALRPGVPLVDVDVGAADGRLAHADQHVVRAGLGFGSSPIQMPGSRRALISAFMDCLTCR